MANTREQALESKLHWLASRALDYLMRGELSAAEQIVFEIHGVRYEMQHSRSACY